MTQPTEITQFIFSQPLRFGVRRNRQVVREDQKYDSVFVLIEGFALRCRILRNGGRQIINVVLPGDYIGVPECLFETATLSVATLTNAVVSPIPHARLLSLFDTCPSLAWKICWSFECESATCIEHLVDLGRRSAPERVAHLLLELQTRLQIIGQADEISFPLPFTQEILGDLLGLSVPHVNRTIRQLREDGLIAIENQRVIVADRQALSSLADFKGRAFRRFSFPDTIQHGQESRAPNIAAFGSNALAQTQAGGGAVALGADPEDIAKRWGRRTG